jgi:hypothetical protein
VGVLGTSAVPSLGRFHAVWLVAAGFCALAAVAAVFLPNGAADARRAGAVTTTPLSKELS